MTFQQYKEEFYNLAAQNDVSNSQETLTIIYILTLCPELQNKMYGFYFIPDQGVHNE